jgi:3-hydroxyacyl-[acyl-carrier-protein] dehydratase
MPPELLCDLATFDLTKVFADQEAIRKFNAQRFEMEQLTAVVHLDAAQHLIIGYKDVGPDEFWTRGHMPGYPLMPGVIMCEAAAQLCSYYISHQKLMDCDYIGLGGLENARFRGPVRPGDRLVLVAKGTRIQRRQVICIVQGFVGNTMVFHVDIIGLPLSRKPGES